MLDSKEAHGDEQERSLFVCFWSHTLCQHRRHMLALAPLLLSYSTGAAPSGVASLSAASACNSSQMALLAEAVAFMDGNAGLNCQADMRSVIAKGGVDTEQDQCQCFAQVPRSFIQAHLADLDCLATTSSTQTIKDSYADCLHDGYIYPTCTPAELGQLAHSQAFGSMNATCQLAIGAVISGAAPGTDEVQCPCFAQIPAVVVEPLLNGPAGRCMVSGSATSTVKLNYLYCEAEGYMGSSAKIGAAAKLAACRHSKEC